MLYDVIYKASWGSLTYFVSEVDNNDVAPNDLYEVIQVSCSNI